MAKLFLKRRSSFSLTNLPVCYTKFCSSINTFFASFGVAIFCACAIREVQKAAFTPEMINLGQHQKINCLRKANIANAIGSNKDTWCFKHTLHFDILRSQEYSIKFS